MAQAITISFNFRNKRFNDATQGLKAFGQSVGDSMERIPAALKEELRKYLDAVAEALARRHGNPWPSGTTAASLSMRSGNLINAIRNSVQVYGSSLNDVSGSISAPFYAAIQEYGGTIRAKNSKYLTIPLPAALNSNGTPKKQSAREWDNTFVIRSKAGNLLIVQRNGKDIIPLYVLKTEVTIPARLHMRDTIEAGRSYFVDTTVERLLKEIQAGLDK